MPSRNSVKERKKGKRSAEEMITSESMPTFLINVDETLCDRELRKEPDLCKFQMPCNVFKGLLCTFFGCLCFNLLNALAKKLVSIDPGDLSMIRHAGMCLGSLPVMIFKRRNLFRMKGKGISLLARAIVGSLALHLGFLSCRLLRLAEAVIVMSTTPTVTMVMARILLKEPCGIMSGLALIITFCGVAISTRIPAIIAVEGFSTTLDANHLLGLASAFGFVLTLSATIILQRTLKHIHYSVVVFSVGMVGIIQNAGITAAFGFFSLPRCGVQRMFAILIAILGYLTVYFFTMAINKEAAGTFILMRTCFDIIMTIIIEIVFFTVYPDIYTISGGFLVLISVGIIVLKKGRVKSQTTVSEFSEIVTRSSYA